MQYTTQLKIALIKAEGTVVNFQCFLRLVSVIKDIQIKIYTVYFRGWYQKFVMHSLIKTVLIKGFLYVEVANYCMMILMLYWAYISISKFNLHVIISAL